MIKINGVSSNKQYLGSQQAWFYKKGFDRSKPITFTNTDSETQCIEVHVHTDYKDALVYSTDGGVTWQTISEWYDEGYQTMYTGYMYVLAGETAMFKTTTSYASNWDYEQYNVRFRNGWGRGSFTVKGNPLSLYYTNFADIYEYKAYEFHNLFYEFYGLTDASELVLDCNIVPDYCFERMFMNCQQFVNPPLIPATTVGMFGYHSMFEHSAITTSPVIPNAAFDQGSFHAMFCDCYYLTQITCLVQGDLSDTSMNYTTYWTRDVPASGTFIKSANGIYVMDSMDGIPEGWTVVNR